MHTEGRVFTFDSDKEHTQPVTTEVTTTLQDGHRDFMTVLMAEVKEDALTVNAFLSKYGKTIVYGGVIVGVLYFVRPLFKRKGRR